MTAVDIAMSAIVVADLIKPAPKALRGTRKCRTDLAPRPSDPQVVANRKATP